MGPRSRCAARNCSNVLGVEGGPGRELDRGHHAVAGVGVGHAVHRAQEHAREPHQDALDRRAGEVLAVDADPVGAAAREVEEAVVVAVAEVAGPVPAVAQALLLAFLVLPVPLERRRRGVDDLTGGLGRVQQPAVVVEAARAGTPASWRDR